MSAETMTPEQRVWEKWPPMSQERGKHDRTRERSSHRATARGHLSPGAGDRNQLPRLAPVASRRNGEKDPCRLPSRTSRGTSV